MERLEIDCRALERNNTTKECSKSDTLIQLLLNLLNEKGINYNSIYYLQRVSLNYDFTTNGYLDYEL